MNGLLFPAFQGFFTGGSLIVAIGAQNAYVLRQGLLRQGVFSVISICAVSDAILILLGCFGFGALLSDPIVIALASAIGAVFLLIYGALACKRAIFAKESLHADDTKNEKNASLVTIASTAMILTWANPHVYLDTVLLLGSIAAQYEGGLRVSFASGAILASFVWFIVLGVGARALSPLFAKPITWRILDLTIATIMWLIAISLIRTINLGLLHAGWYS
ncbi:MAG: LysE/ArgO family amino acid transporter [Pseudomonadota bacterium]